MVGSERRRHKRRAFEEDVYTYIDGSRLDSLSMDVSPGGALFRTEQDLPLGATVAIVFKKQAQLKEPVFMVGTVQRRQTNPFLGVALRWTKAVTQASPSELGWFLVTVLGMSDPQIDHVREPGQWNMLSLHRFAVEAAEVDPGDGQGPDSLESLDAAATRAARILDGEPNSGGFSSTTPDYPRTSEDGSLTVQIARSGLRAPAGINGVLDIGNKSESVRITHLGVSSLFVQTGKRPTGSSESVVVRFNIPASAEKIPIICQCRVSYLDQGDTIGRQGLDLEITRLEEGKHKGILKKFVKWLHFQALATD